MSSERIRVGLIGAGYIAGWHAATLKATPGVVMSAVCDVSSGAAQSLADSYGVPSFSSIEDLINADVCDAVHILTPPDHHNNIAVRCLKAGLHVLVEKPVAVSAEETREIEDVAKAEGKRFHAGHNFLGMPSYERLKSGMLGGQFGRISSAEINWCFPLAPLRSGPFGLWLLRHPRNLLLELGPHLFAFAVDLFGVPEILDVQLSRPTDLPGKDTRYQSWRITARAGGVDLTFNINLVETVDDRSVTLRGSSGRARFDYAADTLIVDRDNASDLVVNPLRRQLDLGFQHIAEGLRNGVVQVASLNRKSPYGLSFQGMNRAIYSTLTDETDSDARFSGASAVKVMEAIDAALDLVPDEKMKVAAPVVQTRVVKPTAMVIGGTGFIGRALTRRLVTDGYDVRVVSRGSTGPFPDLPDQVETVPVSLYDKDGLTAAMQGIDVVFNLAKSMDTTWADSLKNDVAVALRVAMAGEAAGVRRLIYTGTIASYDMSDPSKQITEDTGFAEDMKDRNLYARSKAECEKKLMDLHRDRGLPLVIARPGIVVGGGGPLQHWGIGRWHGAGAVRLWGAGDNILPFTLIDDAVDGLVRMIDNTSAVGQSFNLVGDPMFSGRGYFNAIHQTMGAKIRVSSGNLTGFYAADRIKQTLKKHALRRLNVPAPSLADWKSRAHLSTFVNQKPKDVLGWQPELYRHNFIEKAITGANLFGF